MGMELRLRDLVCGDPFQTPAYILIYMAGCETGGKTIQNKNSKTMSLI